MAVLMNQLCVAMAAVILALLSSCAPTGSKLVSPHRYTTPTQVRMAVRSGPDRLVSISSQLTSVRLDFEQFSRKEGAGWAKRGYLTATESERMEFLWFRFVSAQDVLADLIGSLGGKHSDELFPDERVKTAAHVLVTEAQFLAVHHRAELVALFADDPVAVDKLNEAFPRSEIPRGSYDEFRLSVTAPDVGDRLEAAWDWFGTLEESARMEDLLESDPGYARLAKRMPEDHRKATASLEKVEGRRVAERLEHNKVADLARWTKGGWDDSTYKARSLLFKSVSRIKNPAVKVIKFSDSQHAEVKGLLQPGDIVLTYTAGYMSDVFIPGSFKHGITYIGNPSQRRAAGLDEASLPKAASREARAVSAEFDRATLADGKEADVIEAVAEGVIFNNLGYLMDTHVNRMAVLRPKLSARDRAEFLAEVFSYSGDGYDFLFDFADASKQVCTEVIWRGINGRGGVDMGLTRRGGHPTLSADDVVNYHFATAGRHFEFVLFAEAAGSGRQAVIHTGPDGEERLRKQMEE